MEAMQKPELCKLFAEKCVFVTFQKQNFLEFSLENSKKFQNEGNWAVRVPGNSLLRCIYKAYISGSDALLHFQQFLSFNSFILYFQQSFDNIDIFAKIQLFLSLFKMFLILFLFSFRNSLHYRFFKIL